MNWKLNYWTLLFALAALGLAYQQYATGQNAKPETEKDGLSVRCSGSQDFSIADTTAIQRMQHYNSAYAQKVRQFAADSCNTLNGGVRFFGIHRCELENMAALISEADSVNACLSLLAGNGSAKDTLDLIFEVYLPMTGLTPQYYDFTKPCPPCAE